MAPNYLNTIEYVANIGWVRVAAANTASDGSGVLNTLFTPGIVSARTNGAFLYRVTGYNSQIVAALSSNMVVRFFLTDNTGANPHLILEQALAAATRSLTAVGAYFSYSFPGRGLFLMNGQILKVVQSAYAGVADQMDYTAYGGDL